MKRLVWLFLALAVAPWLPTREARADGPQDIYPELRADASVRIVGRWPDGSYATAIAEYPERSGNAEDVYVWAWDNGTFSVLVAEYPELRPDGNLWIVRRWLDGTYSAVRAADGSPTQPTAALPTARVSRVIDGGHD